MAGYRERGGPLDVTGVERDLTTWQALLAAHPASYADDEAAELDLRARSYILGCVERAKNLERSERDRFLQAALGQETRALTRALGDRRRQRT